MIEVFLSWKDEPPTAQVFGCSATSAQQCLHSHVEMVDWDGGGCYYSFRWFLFQGSVWQRWKIPNFRTMNILVDWKPTSKSLFSVGSNIYRSDVYRVVNTLVQSICLCVVLFSDKNNLEDKTDTNVCGTDRLDIQRRHQRNRIICMTCKFIVYS